MTTLFISDLHLDAARPDIASQFVDFLGGEATTADALYILGDLFEYWLGDDAPDAFQRGVLARLSALSRVTPLFVMTGNRDFLFDHGFEAMSGATLLPDPCIATLHGQRTLLTHGDALCTDDHAYQRLRAALRDPGIRAGLMAAGPRFRAELAGEARAGSRAHTASAPAAIMDVNAQAVVDALAASNADVLLHGHTHRPAIHQVPVGNRLCTRIVLGDWYTQGSVLRWSDDGYALSALTR